MVNAAKQQIASETSKKASLEEREVDKRRFILYINLFSLLFQWHCVN